MRSQIALFALAAVLPALAIAAPATWSVDPVHSTAQFTARHFGIVPVVGTIPIKSASVKLDGNSQIPVAVNATLDPAHLDTHNSDRDDDLRSAHFFDVAANPAMSFTSTKISEIDPKHFTIAGDLTMHGQTHPVMLAAQIVASGKTPRGRDIIAYAATTTVDRTTWGMTYGPMIVGNSIDISLNIEADAP